MLLSHAVWCMGFPGGASDPPANAGDKETWVQSLHWEHPLEKGMAIHCSILAWEIPWTEEAGRPQSIGSHRVRHN